MNIFTMFDKHSLSRFALAFLLAFSLIAQNALFVGTAFATEGDSSSAIEASHDSDSDVSFESSSSSSHDEEGEVKSEESVTDDSDGSHDEDVKDIVHRMGRNDDDRDDHETDGCHRDSAPREDDSTDGDRHFSERSSHDDRHHDEGTKDCDEDTPAPTNTAPVVTLIGDGELSVTQGSSFVDPYATAFDLEDGIVSVTSTGSVDTNVVGSYVITYGATDSKGLAASPKTRTVSVVAGSPSCRAALDVAFVIDHSSSMRFDGVLPEQPLTDAKTAVNGFIDSLSTSTDQAAVISFASSATVERALTSDFSLAKTSVSAITTSYGTNIAAGIEAATAEIASHGRESAKHVMVVLSDGAPNVPGLSYEQALAGVVAAAGNAKTQGIVVYSIGLGSGINPDLMKLVASTPSDYYYAPNGSTLSAIYDRISAKECTRVPAEITGSVVNDANGDGAKSEGETGKPDFSVSLMPLSSSVTPRIETTDASGAFRFADVAPGSYKLCMLAPAGWEQTLPASGACYEMTIAEGDKVSDKLFLAHQTPVVTNQPPVITVLGENPMIVIVGTSFVDPFATAFDPEDGAVSVTATGTVDANVVGSYVITYNATDSKGLAATPKTRTVSVVPAGSVNQKPEITLLGNVIVQLTVGTAYTDAGATAQDPEDGDITSKIIATGTVDVNVVGSYVITYNATDSKNLAADPKTRTVSVVPANTVCTTNCGGGSSTFDYFGCTDPAATNYNSLANKNDGSCRYPGGGGGGSVPLAITNEKLVVSGTTSVTVTWNTNLPSDSRVVYGDASVSTLGAKPGYGYPLTTATDTTYVYNHSMVIDGVPSAIKTYFRPISSTASETATGIELSRVPDVAVPASCEYLKEYLRLGANNNPTEVTKLQLFLKNYESASVEVTGFFDLATDKAVRAFQDKYKKDVLDSWNLPSNTGYVYYTTKKKINEIYCQREFPLDETQKSEIASFRALIDRINSVGSSESVVTLPLVGTNRTTSSGSVAGAATANSPVVVTVAPSTLVADRAAGTDDDAPQATIAERGRIAIADLLATAPSIAEDVASDEEADLGITGTGTDAEKLGVGIVAGTSSTRNLLASVIDSLSSKLAQCSPNLIYLTLFFLVLSLVFATLYVRKAAIAKESETKG